MKEQEGFTFSGLTQTDTSATQAQEAAAPAEESANNADSVELENILGAPAEDKQPETKPEEAEGKKEEGSEDKAEKLPAWISQLPEELKKDETFKAFEKLGDLAKAYKELEEKSKNGIELPSSDPEALKSFYEKLGKPKTAEEYEITGDNVQALRQIAFDNNLTADQAKSVFSSLQKIGIDYMQEQQSKLQEKYTNTNNALKKEYGNEYSQKMQLLAKGLDTYGGKDLRTKLAGSGLAYDIDIIKLFITLGEQSQEANTTVKGNAISDGYKSRAEGGTFTFKGL